MGRKALIDSSTSSATVCWPMCRAIGCRRRGQPVKVTPDMVEPLMKVRGVFPAYHMDRRHWVSVILDGWADDEFILKLLKESFDLTVNLRATPIRTRKVIHLSDRPKLSSM